MKKTVYDPALQNGGKEISPLLEVPLRDTSKHDSGDGQMWSNKHRIPRARSAQVLYNNQDANLIPWEGIAPALVHPVEGELNQICKAAFEGNLVALQECNVDPLSRDASKALNLACRKGHNDVVKYLLGKGVSYDFKDPKTGFTAITFATYFDHGDVMESLCLLGQNSTLPKVEVNGTKLSLLHLAAFYGCCEAIRVFLTNPRLQISPNESDRDHWKPIHYAVAQGHIGAVKLLMKNGANSNAKGLYNVRPLHIAAYKENLKMVKVLLEGKADPRMMVSMNPPRYSFSFELSELENRKSDTLPDVVEYNTKKYSTLLHWAVVKGSVPLVKKMVECGADVDAHDIEGMTPLGLALTKGQKETVTFFTDRNIRLSDEDKNWRRIIDEETGVNVLNTLEVTKLDNVNCSNKEGFSLLHLAASEGYITLLNRLLSRGVSPDLETVRGETALFFAVRNNHQTCAQLLVRGGCNVCHVSKANTSVLHTAAKSNNFLAIDMVLKIISQDKMMDINLTDEKGFTALYYAISSRRYDIVQRFLQFCVAHSLHVDATAHETLLQFYTERNILGQYDNAIVRVLELEKALHSSKTNAEKCLRMQLGTTEASTKTREQLQAMYESTKVELHCWNFWTVITCFFLPSILFFLDVYTDVVLAVEYFNDYVDAINTGNSTGAEMPEKPFQIFKNITDSQSKVNLVLTVFFILFPMFLLSLWSFYVHMTQMDILPVFKRMSAVLRAIIYFFLFIPPFGPIISYIENSYAQIKYLNMTSKITDMVHDEEPRRSVSHDSSDLLRDYYNLKHVAQMRVAINNVLEATLESAFQLVLQLYIVGTQYNDLKELHLAEMTLGSILSLTPTDDSQSRLSKQVLSVLISLVSLTWSFTAYHRFNKLGGLRILWSLPLLFAIFFQIISRAIACTVFTLAYTWRIFIVLGVHLIFVFFLKVSFEKRTEAPKSALLNKACLAGIRPYFYVILGSFTSTFVYFRIQRPLESKDQLSQRHSSFLVQFMFLILALIENVLLFGIGTAHLGPSYDHVFKIVSGVICLVSFIIGVILQWVFYGWFGHPWVNINGPSLDRNEDGALRFSFYKEGGQTQWVMRSCCDCSETFVEQNDNVYKPRFSSEKLRLNGQPNGQPTGHNITSVL